MSEQLNFPDFHRQGEQRVKAAIRNPDGEYEHVGREEDPRVAEAMAHAAKPLIDNVLEAVKNGEPNQLTALKVKGEWGLSDAPKVTYDHTHDFGGGHGYVGKRTVTYGELAADVSRAHQAADKVQVEYYNKVTEAKSIESDAKASL